MKAIEDLRAGKTITGVMREHHVALETLKKWEQIGFKWKEENVAKRRVL